MFSIKQPLKLGLAVLVISSLMLTGCAAINTSLEKSDLDVQTKASESIFLEPVSLAKRVIFVSVRNTSDKDLDLKPRIIQRLTDNDYQVTNDPDLAQFMLQANVLRVGKDNKENADSYIEAGFSGASFGNAVSSSGDSGKGIVIGALVGVIADSFVNDTLFTMVTDLQVRERPRENEIITQQQSESTTQGSGTSISQNSNRNAVDWKTYHTRIVSTANQVNLEFEEALPELENGLIRSIAGFFAE